MVNHDGTTLLGTLFLKDVINVRKLRETFGERLDWHMPQVRVKIRKINQLMTPLKRFLNNQPFTVSD